MVMSVAESLVHALLNEFGRGLFLNKTSTTTYGQYATVHGFASKMWKWLLVSHGERIYDLPREMGLSPLEEARKLPYNFPAYSIASVMRWGLAPSEALTFPTMTGHTSLYTPLHLATALLEFGLHEERDEAERLLDVAFLHDVDKTTPASFMSHTFICPYTPSRYGLRPFELESLRDGTGSLIALDKLGSAMWFPRDYVLEMSKKVEAAQWYAHACRLNIVHGGQWTDLVQKAAQRMLTNSKDVSGRTGYKNSTNYLRNAEAGFAEAHMKWLTGARQALRVVRHDATPEQMATGLRAIVAGSSERIEEVYQYIGRPLAIADFELLKPPTALQALYFAPYDAVKDVIATHSTELGAMFFALTDTKLHLVTNCMSPHQSRPSAWFPDTDDGNMNLLLGSKSGRQGLIDEWNKTMKNLVDEYMLAKAWRDLFIGYGEPAVLFLALMLWASKPDDPVPRPAIENILRSHHNITLLQQHIEAMPTILMADTPL